MTETTSKHGPGVWPGLYYDDAEAGRACLTGLGFTESLTVRDDGDGRIVHGELAWPEGGGVMYGSRRGDGAPPRGAQRVYVVTADPDAVHRRAAAAGAEVLLAPHDTDYGSRNAAVADPEGNVWTLGTYPGA